MDHGIKAALPLVFALAMAADMSAASAAGIPEGENLWRAGSLGQLLGDAAGARSNLSTEGASDAKQQTAQWLNFRNCFSGSWRNC
jgi:hypothetical protein